LVSTAVAIHSNVYYLPHSPPFPTLTSSSSSARRRRAPPPPLLCALPPSGLLGGRSCKVLQGAVRSCRRQGAAGKELPPAQAVGKELPPPSMCWRANKATRKKPGEQCGAEEARRTRRRGRNPANKATAEEARRRRAWRPPPRRRGLEAHRHHLAVARAPGGGSGNTGHVFTHMLLVTTTHAHALAREAMLAGPGCGTSASPRTPPSACLRSTSSSMFLSCTIRFPALRPSTTSLIRSLP
jgi:hypothetical protein